MRSKPFFATIIVYVYSLLGSDLSAQQFNIKAGINSTSYILGFYRPNFEDVTKIYWGNDVGVKVGAEYVVSLTDFFDADFGLFYAQRRAIDEFQQGEEIVYTALNMNNIELPVNVRWKLRRGNFNWHLRTGVLVGLLMQAHQKVVLTPISKSESSQEYINNLSIGGTGNYKRVDFSGGLGLGVTWKKISLNVDYYQTIGSTVNEPENNIGSFVRWNMWNIALGYMFGNSLNSK